ncbi:IS66 family insertion sequence element accessory protein TnpA, partial [Undibacterium sp. Di27W]|uniref:IS66 family insertion sequence element accessory protein TnpA n=1 Tax=Undibacterium sp. Di27W TaxID=3413036 RepID=UPI003BF373E9
AFWRKQCQDWQGSGLSQRAFCQREGLVYSSFDYWRRRAAPVVASKKTVQPRALTLVAAVAVPDAHPQSAIPPVADTLHLRSPGGWQINLPLGITEAVMASVSQLLLHLP